MPQREALELNWVTIFNQETMKIKSIFWVVLFSSISLMSCKKDFKEINTNVNFPVDVEPDLLLRQVIYSTGENNSYEGFVAGNLLGQHFSMVDFNLFDRHNLSQPQLGGNPWPFLYRNLRDNEIVLQKSASDEIYAVYEGPARIMKAYIAQLLTDMYGDVPYSEAVQGVSGIVTPKYDSQESIYVDENGIIDQLNKAIEAIDNYAGTQTLGGDILYYGDLSKWRKLANSLKIKALIRISDRDGEIALDISQELQAIYAEGDFIANNFDNAVFQFSSSQPNSFRMEQLRPGDFNLYVMSQTADTIFQELNDPRFSVFFRGTGNDPLVLNGLINGIDNSQTTISISDYSLAGTVFRENTGDLQCNFMTAWETQFLLAEAANKGYIAENAQGLYEDGVANAFAYWNVTMPANYLSSGPAVYNAADGLEQIITQKWIANCINGYECWIEYSRTGFPQLLPVSASLNGGDYPVRLPYPADEIALNQGNYDVAAGNAGGNSVNSKVWWDVF
ncbi:MAG: hypothetical protein ACJAUD_000916 [Crocinitomicaceae bacterium]|jgi:hypothetical protein